MPGLTTDREPLAKVKPPVPGGEYTAKQNRDGTWNVYNVPVFAEHARKFDGVVKTVNKAWMSKAKDRGERRILEDSFLPPLHIRHHGNGVDAQRAGHFRLRKIEQMQYEGKMRWMAFADYIAVPDFVYEMIRRGELPYCSVEVHDMDDPEINSVALLDTEVPFFRLPLMTIGTEVPVGEPERFETAGSPAVAYRALGSTGELALFRFAEEASMKIIRVKKYSNLTDEQKELIVTGQARYECDEEKKEGTFQDEDEMKKEDEKSGESLQDDGTPPAAPVAPAAPAAPTVTLDQLAQMIAALPSKIAAAIKGAPPSDEEVPSDITASASASGAEDGVKLYKAEERILKLETASATDNFIAEARAQATPYGVDVDKLEKRLRAEVTKYNLEAGKRWLDAYLEDKEVDPPTNWEGDLDKSVVDGLPDEVKSYVDKGDPNQASKAIFYSKEFDDLEKRGIAATTKEEYIRDAIAYDARIEKEAQERETAKA